MLSDNNPPINLNDPNNPNPNPQPQPTPALAEMPEESPVEEEEEVDE